MTFSSVLSRTRVAYKGLSSACRVRLDFAHLGIRRFHTDIVLKSTSPSASPAKSDTPQSGSTSGQRWWPAWLEKVVGAGLVAGIFTVFYQMHEAHFARASTRQGVGEAWALLRHYWRTVDNSSGRTHSSNQWHPVEEVEAPGVKLPLVGFRMVPLALTNGPSQDQLAFLQRVGEDFVDVMRALNDSGRVTMEKRFRNVIELFEVPPDGGDTKERPPSPSDSNVRRFEAVTAYALEKATGTVWTHHLFLRRSDPVFRVPTVLPLFLWNIFWHRRFGFMPTHVSLGYEGCLMQDLNKVLVMRMAMYIVHGNQPGLEGLKDQYGEFRWYAWACYRANFLTDGDLDTLSQHIDRYSLESHYVERRGVTVALK